MRYEETSPRTPPTDDRLIHPLFRSPVWTVPAPVPAVVPPRTHLSRRMPRNLSTVAPVSVAPALSNLAAPVGTPAVTVVAPKPSLMGVLASLKPSLLKADPFLRRLERTCALTLNLHGLSVCAREVLESLAASGVHVTVDPVMQASITDKALLDAAVRAGRRWLDQGPTLAPVAVVPKTVLPPVPVPAIETEPTPAPAPLAPLPINILPVPWRNPARLLGRTQTLPLRVNRPAGVRPATLLPTSPQSMPGDLFRFADDSQSSFAQSPVGQMFREVRRASDAIVRRFSNDEAMVSSDSSDSSDNESAGVRTPTRYDEPDSSESNYSQPSTPRTPYQAVHF